MRKALLWLICIAIWLMAVTALAQEPEPKAFELPNVQAAVFYDFKDESCEAGVLSQILSWEDILGVQVGYITPSTAVLGISYNLIDLERCGLEYRWTEYLHVRIGVWSGYDFTNERGHYGIECCLIDVAL